MKKGTSVTHQFQEMGLQNLIFCLIPLMDIWELVGRHTGKTALAIFAFPAGKNYKLARLVSKHRTYITEVSRKIKCIDLVLENVPFLQLLLNLKGLARARISSVCTWENQICHCSAKSGEKLDLEEMLVCVHKSWIMWHSWPYETSVLWSSSLSFNTFLEILTFHPSFLHTRTRKWISK